MDNVDLPRQSGITMELKKKVARMAMGLDHHDECSERPKRKRRKHTARVLHEVDKRTSRSKIVEMFEESEAYIDSLVDFHKDAMDFLRSLDVYSTSDRLEKLNQLQALMESGEKIKVYD